MMADGDERNRKMFVPVTTTRWISLHGIDNFIAPVSVSVFRDLAREKNEKAHAADPSKKRTTAMESQQCQ